MQTTVHNIKILKSQFNLTDCGYLTPKLKKIRKIKIVK